MRKTLYPLLHLVQLVQVLGREPGEDLAALRGDLLFEMLLSVLPLFNFNFQDFLQRLYFVQYLRVTFFLCFALLLGLYLNLALYLIVVVFQLA